MDYPLIKTAIQTRHLLRVRYDGYTRIVEPHAYGISKEGHEVMRAWQVSGESVHHEPLGWKMLRLDEAHALNLLPGTFQEPRRGYKRGDKVMQRIYAQL